MGSAKRIEPVRFTHLIKFVREFPDLPPGASIIFYP